MAEQNASPLHLQWGRNDHGAFVISVVAMFPAPDGRMIGVPVRSWALSQDEESFLKAALGGIHIATGLVAADGRELLH